MGAGGRLGAPRSGGHGAAEHGAGPSIRALEPVPIGAVRTVSVGAPTPQPQWAGGRRAPAAPPSLLQ
eukprot:3623261-Alexandrium_andersonii.AAC.1